MSTNTAIVMYYAKMCYYDEPNNSSYNTSCFKNGKPKDLTDEKKNIVHV